MRTPNIWRVRVVAALALLAPATVIAQQPVQPRPGTYTVKRGDTLWDLAKRFLNDPYLWPQIYRINTDQIKDPHWIYPGEVLNLPQAVASAPAPRAPAVAEAPAGDFNGPTIFAPQVRRGQTVAIAQEPMIQPPPVVRLGEYVAAPYVDRVHARRDLGKILGSAELAGIAAAEPSRFPLFHKVFVTPPVGSVAAEGDRYVVVEKGPLIEGLGQIIIPTGVLRVTQAPRYGEAAVAEVVELFSDMTSGQQLVPYDTSVVGVKGTPTRVASGRWSKVQWISSQPVLPTVQAYLVLNLSSKEGVKVGDRFELFRPRQSPAEPGDLALPEIPIARASAVRVTPFATTVILDAQDQPKIEPGTMARISAQMP